MGKINKLADMNTPREPEAKVWKGIQERITLTIDSVRADGILLGLGEDYYKATLKKDAKEQNRIFGEILQRIGKFPSSIEP